MASVSKNQRYELKSVCTTHDAELVLTQYPPGLSVRNHHHSHGMIGMLIRGEMQEVHANKQAYHCKAFNIGLQPDGCSHSNKIGDSGLRSVMILFDKSFPRRLGVEPADLNAYRFFLNTRAIKLGLDIYRKSLSRRISESEFCELSQSMFRSIADQNLTGQTPRPAWLSDEQLSDSLELSSRPIQTIASDARRHPDFVSRALRRYLGEAHSQYRNRFRVCEAARLLTDSNQSAASVSAEFGFSDQAHMSRLFKKYLGLPPMALRSLVGAEL